VQGFAPQRKSHKYDVLKLWGARVQTFLKNLKYFLNIKKRLKI